MRYMCKYIYIYRERERKRERYRARARAGTGRCDGPTRKESPGLIIYYNTI